MAQFMYQDSAGQPDTAFLVGQNGPTQVFYWVDQRLGYALSGALARAELLRVSQEDYRQLAPG